MSKVVTIQRTSKTIKLVSVLGVLGVGFGIYVTSQGFFNAGGVIMGLSAIVLVINKIARWWNHD
jgi:hypothetical protein